MSTEKVFGASKIGTSINKLSQVVNSLFFYIQNLYIREICSRWGQSAENLEGEMEMGERHLVLRWWED